ncbi:protein kinase domain-containing protein [Iningainema tapete]|uniref:non-specific serine/threonine protein kinase n=1 Tax=Iningainema tapete BLCC-T55 TaxID=2748662 RepID=A0A8J6XCU2_9CYAN|nr:protein kinase [Iningainema tapete]MBD2770783.1 protein kinase [Iningainema tapete BLCC-T55]
MLVGQILRQRYKITRLLGSGSFGVTYLAEDLDLPDHPVCVVKNLKQSHNPEYLRLARVLFDREAKVLYQLGSDCKEIPRLFAHFEEKGEFYLVQEFIDGHNLSEEIFPGKRWSEAEVTQLLQEVLEVLTFIHNQNIIHRDIKPQNLMRRKTDGKIVLIDFGAVKQISGLVVNAQGQTNVSVIVGTSGYMPSEQLNGLPKLSSDVYAVGMLGIYALTGIKPQDLPRDSGSCEIFWRNLVSVSPKLADVLDKMVCYHFNQRYQTAAEALQALKGLSSSPLLPPPSPLQQPSQNFIIRELVANQKFLIGAVVGAGMLLGVGLLFMSFWPQSTPEPEKTVVSSVQPTLEPEETTKDTVQATDDVQDVQLVCPEIPIPPLPSNSGRKIGPVTVYGFPNDSSLSPTGKGIMIFPDRKFSGVVRYDGEFKDGKFNGCGNLTRGNGERYLGQFENNSFQGIGKYSWKNGCQYVGEFKNNQFDGQGTWISKDGSRSSGIWQQGKLQGKAFSCQ